MRIISFDGYALPQARHTQKIPLTLDAPLVQIAGMAGGFDVLGDVSVRQSITVTHTGLIYGTAAAIDTALDTLRGKTNKRGWLLVETRAGVKRGTWAKLLNVSIDDEMENVNHLPVSLAFQIAWPWWQTVADGWYFDAGFEFDDGLYFDGNYSTRSGSGSLSIANTGGGPIQTGIIEVRGSATNPAITNTTNGWSITYTGSVASGSTLLIDIGAQTATLAGVNVWANVTLGDDQTGLMRLNSGINAITYTGGGTLVWHWAKVY